MLTDTDIKALRREFGDQFRNLTEEQWRDLLALLPPRSKWRKRDRKIGGRSTNFMARKWRELAALMPPGSKRPRFFRMFAVAANYYWQCMEDPTPVKDYRQQLTTAIEALQGSMETLSKLGSRSIEDRTKLKAMIDAYQQQRYDLRYHVDFYEGAAFQRRELVLNLLLIWQSCGGEIKSSRKTESGEPSGPLIAFLMFGCGVVMDQQAPAAETLRADIKDFKNRIPNDPYEPMDSKMWNPAWRRPRKEEIAGD